MDKVIAEHCINVKNGGFVFRVEEHVPPDGAGFKGFLNIIAKDYGYCGRSSHDFGVYDVSADDLERISEVFAIAARRKREMDEL